MKNGLVFGKFMPLHEGHLSLISFGSKNCDTLNVVLCYHQKEIIAGEHRLQWLSKAIAKLTNVNLVSFEYDENVLPDTSVSSVGVSNIWANAFKKLLPQTDVVFTSEDYGVYVAKAMQIAYICFDKNRTKVPVSGSAIRANPFIYWDYICSEARPYFVKKIAILGSESTGKSILTERLANYYNTTYISEAGREIVEKTELCNPEDLERIATAHAKNIIKQISRANRLLFLDTDLNITRSYSSFLFNRDLKVTAWQEDANKSDLCLFLETDCPYVQDGTRLNKQLREKLSISHKNALEKNLINYIAIHGDWADRFNKAREIINQKYFYR